MASLRITGGLLLAALALGLGGALPAAGAGDPHQVNSYALTQVMDSSPRVVFSLGRLFYGYRDDLLLGTSWGLSKLTGQGQIEHFADLNGPGGRYHAVTSIFDTGPFIEVAVNSNGQGCRHEVFYVDESGGIKDHTSHSYEWTHADHDMADQGMGWLCPRTGRKFLGYGNPSYVADWPPAEEGQHLKGLLMEYNGPDPGVWGSWTNQLCIPGAASSAEMVGLTPRGLVVLDDGQVLVSTWGSNGGTYLALIQSKPWDGPLLPNAGSRAPQKQGYWSLASHPATGQPLRFGGDQRVYDPYVEGGDFNQFIFLVGDQRPWYSRRDDPTGFWQAGVYKGDGAGGWVEAEAMDGGFFAFTVHPVTGRPLIASGMSFGVGIYEAALTEGGGVAFYEVAWMDVRGELVLGGHAAGQSAYFVLGGAHKDPNRGGPILRLDAQ